MQDGPIAIPARQLSPRLIGRDDLIRESQEHLAETVLIASATGEGGIGTTAVARTVAYGAADAYPDGCIVVNLRSGGPLGPEPLTPVQIQRQVLRRLQGMTDPADLPEDPPALRRMYQGVLSERKALLVLDDAVGAAQLRHLLPQTGSTAIVTTHHDLSASYPKMYAVKVGGLPAAEAYRLISQVAPLAAELSATSMAPLVAKLRGVPLALRVVAPLLGKRPPRLLPNRLVASLDVAQKRFTALRGSNFPNLAVHTAIEVAYESLDTELKPYFEGLGVFPAPFTARAAATVWNTSPKEAEQILTQLANLAMLDQQGQSSDYEIHYLVRMHAQELLLSQPDRARELVSRYVEHFMREVIRAGVEAKENQPKHMVPQTDPYLLWEHLPAAWIRVIGADPAWPPPKGMQRWVCDFPRHSEVQLRYALSRDDHRAWLASALAAAEALHDPAMTHLHLGTLGQMSALAGDNEAALSCFKRQADAARESQDAAGEASALMSAGVAYGALGQIGHAAQAWQSALIIFEGTQDRRADKVRVWLRELRNRFNARP